jgi:hypothetical protein
LYVNDPLPPTKIQYPEPATSAKLFIGIPMMCVVYKPVAGFHMTTVVMVEPDHMVAKLAAFRLAFTEQSPIWTQPPVAGIVTALVCEVVGTSPDSVSVFGPVA